MRKLPTESSGAAANSLYWPNATLIDDTWHEAEPPAWAQAQHAQARPLDPRADDTDRDAGDQANRHQTN